MENGEDALKEVKQAGRYKEFKRTEGISTTDLVQRILQWENLQAVPVSQVHDAKEASVPSWRRQAAVLSTGNLMKEFASTEGPKPNDKIVYVAGDWDLLHPGHVDFLEAARAEGDYMIVGIHSDSDVNRLRGGKFPILNSEERTLSVMSCRCVSEIVSQAPINITRDLLDELKIDVVCGCETEILPQIEDMFQEAKTRGIFKLLRLDNVLTTNDVIERITNNRACYEERNKKKLQREKNDENEEEACNFMS